MNVRYLITDKNYDLVQDGIFYDTQMEQPLDGVYQNPQRFVGDFVDVLATARATPHVQVGSGR